MKEPKKRQGTLYQFVLKTWLSYIYLTKIQVRFKNASDFHILKQSFLKRKGKETKQLFFSLGGIYIKIGQFLSNLFHILPEEYLWELQDLQDKVPPKSFIEFSEGWALDHSQKLHEVFSDISETAYASASTAQVHTGFHNGRKVAIKVLYKGIKEEAEGDLKAICRVIWFIDTFVVKISGKEVISQLKEMIRLELNLKNELEALVRTKELFQNEKDFYFPEPILEFCTKNVLVTEFVEGKKIYELSPNFSPNKKNPYLQKLIRAYIIMLFEHRFYHADPHPGNLIFLESGEVCFIDFGAVQSVTIEETKILEKILIGAMRRDYHLIAECLIDLGAVTESLEKEELVQIIKYSLSKLSRILSNTSDFRNIGLETLRPMEDLRFLKEIQVSLKRLFSSLKLPANFLSLHRVLALLLGNFSYLDPTHSIFEYAEKPFSTIVLKGGSLKKLWRDEGEEMLSSLFALPKELNDLLYKINRGEFPPKEGGTSRNTILLEILTFGLLGSIFFFFGMYYAEKSWKEPSLLFYILSGLSFWSLAKSGLMYWKIKQ